MNEHPIHGMMGLSIDKIREMADANTVVGTPIHTADGTTLIPISKLSVGFATGGADFGTQKKGKESEKVSTTDEKSHFGGGAGAGVNITPIAFLVIPPDGNVRMLTISAPASTALDRVVDMVPDILQRVQNFLKTQKEPDESEKS